MNLPVVIVQISDVTKLGHNPHSCDITPEVEAVTGHRVSSHRKWRRPPGVQSQKGVRKCAETACRFTSMECAELECIRHDVAI